MRRRSPQPGHCASLGSSRRDRARHRRRFRCCRRSHGRNHPRRHRTRRRHLLAGGGSRRTARSGSPAAHHAGLRCPATSIRCIQAGCGGQALPGQCHCRIYHRCRDPHSYQPAAKGTGHGGPLRIEPHRAAGIHRRALCRTRQSGLRCPGGWNLGRHVHASQDPPQDALGARGRWRCHGGNPRLWTGRLAHWQHSFRSGSLPVWYPGASQHGRRSLDRGNYLFDLQHDLRRIPAQLRRPGKNEEDFLQAQPRPGTHRTGTRKHWCGHVHGNAHHLGHC
mmetsp:Transcript_16453/g.35828  ORF Transcript_16453/g.35828 Transcript_16453/m.35828 type:complete len:278 (+) Transcript_16453:387-1220(+)